VVWWPPIAGFRWAMVQRRGAAWEVGRPQQLLVPPPIPPPRCMRYLCSRDGRAAEVAAHSSFKQRCGGLQWRGRRSGQWSGGGGLPGRMGGLGSSPSPSPPCSWQCGGLRATTLAVRRPSGGVASMHVKGDGVACGKRRPCGLSSSPSSLHFGCSNKETNGWGDSLAGLEASPPPPSLLRRHMAAILASVVAGGRVLVAA
jgi:hypothetical protein